MKCARWVPYQLTEEQKEQRVTICRSLLGKFEPNGPNMFSDVVTGNYYCVFLFTMKNERSNMVWMAED